MAKEAAGRSALNLGLDTWAVILALVLALAVRSGLLVKVPW
jgi:hypothetical protein